ncbi:hypothetical protein [Sanyastnella coralliicola]|uniref:hypothetical protein n=1 Tax=Sanyastnella coralliicola TaxID=3069118 RepID=UPI0027B8CCC8|nr:hypothetical protein [Longitalea sp. SCSIO 12813]
MLEIEFSPPNLSTCDCCGNTTVRLTRFLRENGDAYGVYYCVFTIGHDVKVVNAVVSLGDWGTDFPEQRFAFPFRIWMNEGQYQVGLRDKEECEWEDVEILGKMLNREEALKHPWIKEVFHVTDHIVWEDKEVIAYLNDAWPAEQL